MDESLYDKWIEEEIEDMQEAMFYNGVNGVLFQFERWLKDNYEIKEKEIA